MLPLANRVRYVYFAYFSHPAADRAIYRAIHRGRVRNIVEIGVGVGERLARMINVAKSRHVATELRYTGIDLFEARDAEMPQGLPLKQIHRLLAASGVRARLVPGDPYSALARVANSLQGTDLVVISADQAGPSLMRAWFYLPRILHPQAQVFLESADPQTGEKRLRIVDRAEVKTLASSQRRRAA